jgi:hypothetical protein
LRRRSKTMTISITKSLALGGLCALMAGLGSAASAQGYGDHGPYHHGPMHHARAAVLRQKAAYAHDVATGHYGAAERAHLRAQSIRHHIRAHRMMEHGRMMDHGYGYHHDHGY